MAKEDYFNPFPKQPLRLLWFADDRIYHRFVRNKPVKSVPFKLCRHLCDYLDDKLWDHTEEFFQEEV
jgi:hypothetical protein